MSDGRRSARGHDIQDVTEDCEAAQEYDRLKRCIAELEANWAHAEDDVTRYRARLHRIEGLAEKMLEHWTHSYCDTECGGPQDAGALRAALEAK